MKKGTYCLAVFVLVICMLLVNLPKEVQANAGDIGGGTWVTPGSSDAFKTVNVDKAAKNAPAWLQQLSEGIVITAPEKICYPFAGGRYHWQPQIMQLSAGKWSKVDTKATALYGQEAEEYACATPKTAGTFALFGFYNGPAEVESNLPECSTITFYDKTFYYDPFDEVSPYTIELFARAPFNVGETVTLTVLSADPSTEDYSGLVGKTFSAVSTGADGVLFFPTYSVGQLPETLTIRLTSSSCYQDFTIEGSMMAD